MSDRSRGLLEPAAYQHAIRREADALLAALSGVDQAAPVPACPEWTVRDLVVHLGKVHIWAEANSTAPPDQMAAREQPGPGATDVVEWYGGTVDALLRRLGAVDPDGPAWTFQRDNPTARFWFRRQAHELGMHRADVEAAAGMPYRYDPELASDGVAEVFDVFLPSRTRYRLAPLELARPLLVECTDRPERWLVEPVPGSDNTDHRGVGPVLSDERVEGALGALRGPAAGLLFTFWKRQDVASAGLELVGDTEQVGRFAGTKLTP